MGINLSKADTKILKKLMQNRNLLANNRQLVEFICAYIESEAIAREIINIARRKRKRKTKKGFTTLSYEEVYNSSVLLGMKISKENVRLIFEGGNGIRGKKTPRQLRNPIFHSKKPKDVEEVIDRYEHLMLIMKEWQGLARKI